MKITLLQTKEIKHKISIQDMKKTIWKTALITLGVWVLYDIIRNLPESVAAFKAGMDFCMNML
ncbi:hypothetical protein Tanf_02200 [Tannerella forsythia]|nr:hypothetical protein Tanf_02200 [Tannerella forsythia]OLQ20132.1 hypothetical protein BGK60_04165 [Tannerella forsythia]